MKISYLKTVPLQNVRSNLQPRDYLNISSFRGPLSLSLPKEKVFQGASDTTRERRRNISGIYNSIPLLVLGYQGIGYWTHQPRHFDLFLSQSSILFVKKKKENFLLPIFSSKSFICRVECKFIFEKLVRFHRKCIKLHIFLPSSKKNSPLRSNSFSQSIFDVTSISR